MIDYRNIKRYIPGRKPAWDKSVRQCFNRGRWHWNSTNSVNSKRKLKQSLLIEERNNGFNVINDNNGFIWIGSSEAFKDKEQTKLKNTYRGTQKFIRWLYPTPRSFCLTTFKTWKIPRILIKKQQQRLNSNNHNWMILKH